MAVSAESLTLMAQNWRYSSRKARRELGYRARRLDMTLRETIDWYRELLEGGVLGPGRPSALSTTVGMRFAGRLRLLRGVQLAERYWDRRLLAAG